MDLSLQLYGRKLNRHCPRCLVDETKQNPYANSGSAESPEFDTMYLLLHNVFNFQFHTNKYWSEFHQKLLDLFIHWQWSIFAWAAHLTGPTSCFNTSQPVANSSKNYVAGHCDLSPTLQAKQQSNGDTLDTGRELFKIFSYKILFAKEQKHNWIEKLQGDDGCSNQNYVLVIQTQEA